VALRSVRAMDDSVCPGRTRWGKAAPDRRDSAPLTADPLHRAASPAIGADGAQP